MAANSQLLGKALATPMAQSAPCGAQLADLAATRALAIGCLGADALGVVVASVEVGYGACTSAYAGNARYGRRRIVAVVDLRGYMFLLVVLVAAHTTPQTHAAVLLSRRSRAVDARSVAARCAPSRPCQVAERY